MRYICAMAAAAALFAGAPQLARAQAADQKTSDQKTAEQVFKNITALKGIPADELMPTMQFMAASLGVECGFCHVQGKMDADDKGPKRTARQMIAMTMAINKDSFRGRVQVSCYSCHRGAEQPVGIPPVQETDTPAPAEARNAGPAGVAPQTADEIVQK